MTPRLVELVRELQEASEKLCLWEHSIINTPLGQVCPGDLIDRAATELSRLMAEGGLVGAASPAASLEVTDGARWRALMWCPRIRLYGCAGVEPVNGKKNENPGVHFGADFWSYGPVADEQSGPKQTEWAKNCLIALTDELLQASEGCGSSNPVDDGAVERMRKALLAISEMYCGDQPAASPHSEEVYLRMHIGKMRKAALEAAEPHP